MKKISHRAQQKAWDDEHKKPTVLKQMHSEDASHGVEKFFEFLKSENIPRAVGVEMGCGKGRNVIWLSKQGSKTTGFDFSPAAIKEAKRRAKNLSAKFLVADATKRWPFKSDTFDFGVDCFASTDIESTAGRRKAISEMKRVLKPGGYLMSYMHAVGGKFHKHVVRTAPSFEKNSFIRGDGKFEKIFDKTEVKKQFEGFKVLKWEVIEKETNFENEKYANKHFWIIFRKPH
jgi:SAM-dependent methyltransferase